MDEQKFTGEPLNLSFPAVQNQQKANEQDGRVESPAASGDIVDTFWDFQPLTFPSFADEIDQKGPRHAAPKKGILGSKGSSDEASDTSTATQHGESGSTTGQVAPNTVFLPATVPSEAPQNDNQAGEDAAQQTTVLTPQQAFAANDSSTVVMPDAVRDTDTDETASRRSNRVNAGKSHGDKAKHNTVIIAVAVIIVVIVAVAGGVALWRNGQTARHETAVSDCTKAAEQYNAAKKTLDKALSDAKNLQSVTASQVNDGETVKQLKQQLDVAKQFSTAPSCAANQSTATLKTNTKAMNEQISDMTTSANAVRKAVTAVSTSKAAKDLQSLKDEVGTAQALMTSSKGEVSDESTRSALQEAIDAANALISKNSTDDAAIASALSALRSASDKVENSMSAATSQSASGNDGTYGYTTYGNAYGYNTNGYNGYGNGTYNDGQNQNNTNTGRQQNTVGNDSDSGSNSGNVGGEASGSGGTGNTGGNSQNGAGTGTGNGSESGSGTGNTQSSGQSSGNNQ